MRSTILVITLAMAAAVPAFADDARTPVPGERPWLSIPQVHDRLDAAGYRHIEKIEREAGSYEVRATDRNGERVKIHVNPLTGEVAGRGDRKPHASERTTAQGGSRSPDCNKRRCRDDLPAPAARADRGTP